MAKINSVPARIDSDVASALRRLAKLRLDKGLAGFNQRELSYAEMTRLLKRTEGWKMSLKELEIKPKRENLEKQFRRLP